MPLDLRPSLPLLRTIFDRNLSLLARMVDGVDEEAARAPLIEGGSHLHWLLGHLVVSRDGLLVHLGAERVWDSASAAAFGRGSGPDAPVLATIDEQLGRLRTQQLRIEEALGSIDDATLARDAGRMTVGATIEFLAWHETYHLGQSTLYRRAAGLASPVG
jgi:uncharacterized damage-inducible protein DinB